METTVYVRLRRRIVVPPASQIRLRDVARIVAEPEVERSLLNLELQRIRPEDGSLLVIDMLHIVRMISQAVPGIVIETFGEPHVLVEVSSGGVVKPRPIVLALAWLLLFFGSGMALINFHADVNMPAVQRRVTRLLTGDPDWHPWLFQIPYSLGVGLGMLLFFNRLFRRRSADEPNPLEVEMFMYQENVNHYVITDDYRKKHEQDRENPND
ncbi:stage V sporulation protein AA [Cohnella lubricantis]|uniref:Stage V sporulation protein AA n=1 Tax=Cohnella lubricantis TaxID=2163172 RepID=A0A841TEN4_9BACL|nr:stage V sporulation protein AA [Cohnella lubricantis]MBB6677690.1 stage V sporulation protein AA [Cohnella lubricantis]MBP2117652.1 stage V sporulation protein AA [Cohnella lubricantis]